MAAAIFFIISSFLESIIQTPPDKPFATHASGDLEGSHTPKYFCLLPNSEAVEIDKSITYSFESFVKVCFVMWISNVKADVRKRSKFGTASVGGITSQNPDSILAIFG